MILRMGGRQPVPLSQRPTRSASLTVPTPVGLPINWSNSPPTLLSRQTNDFTLNAEFYVSSIQFHAVALTPAQLAGIGSPDNGPAPANDTSVGPQPVLSATVSGGMVNLSWTGSPYVLQETTDLTSGVWVDSALPFTESQVNGNILTTAIAAPATTGAEQVLSPDLQAIVATRSGKERGLQPALHHPKRLAD